MHVYVCVTCTVYIHVNCVYFMSMVVSIPENSCEHKSLQITNKPEKKFRDVQFCNKVTIMATPLTIQVQKWQPC